MISAWTNTQQADYQNDCQVQVICAWWWLLYPWWLSSGTLTTIASLSESSYYLTCLSGTEAKHCNLPVFTPRADKVTSSVMGLLIIIFDGIKAFLDTVTARSAHRKCIIMWRMDKMSTIKHSMTLIYNDAWLHTFSVLQILQYKVNWGISMKKLGRDNPPSDPQLWLNLIVILHILSDQTMWHWKLLGITWCNEASIEGIWTVIWFTDLLSSAADALLLGQRPEPEPAGPLTHRPHSKIHDQISF